MKIFPPVLAGCRDNLTWATGGAALTATNRNNHKDGQTLVILDREHFGCVGIVLRSTNGRRLLRISANQAVHTEKPFGVEYTNARVFNQFTIEELQDLVCTT